MFNPMLEERKEFVDGLRKVYEAANKIAPNYYAIREKTGENTLRGNPTDEYYAVVEEFMQTMLNANPLPTPKELCRFIGAGSKVLCLPLNQIKAPGMKKLMEKHVQELNDYLVESRKNPEDEFFENFSEFLKSNNYVF